MQRFRVSVPGFSLAYFPFVFSALALILAGCQDELGQIGNSALVSIGAQPVNASGSNRGFAQIAVSSSQPRYSGKGEISRVKLAQIDYYFGNGSAGQSIEAMRSFLPHAPLVSQNGVDYYQVENSDTLVGFRYNPTTQKYDQVEFGVNTAALTQGGQF